MFGKIGILDKACFLCVLRASVVDFFYHRDTESRRLKLKHRNTNQTHTDAAEEPLA